MECNKSVMTTILAGVILSWGLLLSADDHKQIVIDMKEFKVSENEFQAYLDSTGLGAMMSNDQGELIGGLFWSDAAWIMWQKNIFLPTNDSDRAEWRWPTNVPVGKLQTQVCASKAPLFDILIAGDVIAKGEVKQYNSYREQRESFLNKYSGPVNSSRLPSFIFTFAQRLDVSYLGAETNMLYITERGSREDSLTYKNITLNIRYTDDSLAKHRKAIAVALMNAGAVLKPRDHKDSVSGRAADKEAVDGEKKKDLKENAETRTVKIIGTVSPPNVSFYSLSHDGVIKKLNYDPEDGVLLYDLVPHGAAWDENNIVYIFGRLVHTQQDRILKVEVSQDWVEVDLVMGKKQEADTNGANLSPEPRP